LEAKDNIFMSSPDPENPTSSLSSSPLSPEGIIQLGLGFMASRTLLSAVEMGVFTTLAGNPMDGETLSKKLGIGEQASC
jgi:hypothetical protein